MTKDELSKLTPNKRVRMFHLKRDLTGTYLYGYVMKIDNGNWQVRVRFDGEPKDRVVGYSQINYIV